MTKLLELTNDFKRKKFLMNYQEWPLVRMDTFNEFYYYRYTFDDGSYFTALDYKGNFGVKRQALITLTKAGKRYVPVSDTQSTLIEHLKVVVR